MQLFNSLSPSSARAGALVMAAAFAFGLAACSSNMDDLADATATGSPFTQALFKDYSDLAHQAAALPPVTAPSSGGFFDSLNPFSDSGSSDTSANDALSDAFANKALIAARGDEPEPEAAPDQVSGAIRARLVRALAASKEQSPEDAARAQADYDCWVMYGGYPSAAAASQACKTSLDSSLSKLEGGRPAPAPVPAPPPPPVTMAPAPAPAPAPSAAEAPAPAQGEYTVYFDFDSWTLTAEDLKVIDTVIATARSGGQSHITIVGHTDTSGPADYNQKLSVRRANVVVEALVDLGARRAAIHASGVGETDLAVPTPDGVKEAKNRRAVVTLQP